MIKILHSADWHLDAPISGRTASQSALLRKALLSLPGKIAALAKAQNCDLILLSGDLFDGEYTRDSFEAVVRALAEAEMPVFIAPGNHDPVTDTSPYTRESWPENVHIFRHPALESVTLPQFNAKIYGAGYAAMDCPPLLEGFQAQGPEEYHIAVLHGDPLNSSSPYCPISAAAVRSSGLDYLALGHIHKDGQLRSGDTSCAWPGCPQGHGFDELGPKGVYIVTLDQDTQIEFVPLDGPRFYELEVCAGEDPLTAVESVLPAAGSKDFYRVTLTSESKKPDINALQRALPQFPNLTIIDHTAPLADLWGTADEDSLEGTYFRLLREALEVQDEEVVTLAARISRRILDGREVELP